MPVLTFELPDGSTREVDVHQVLKYTGRINRIGMGSVFWSRSYFAGSCGGAPLSIIRQYIEGQKRPV